MSRAPSGKAAASGPSARAATPSGFPISGSSGYSGIAASPRTGRPPPARPPGPWPTGAGGARAASRWGSPAARSRPGKGLLKTVPVATPARSPAAGSGSGRATSPSGGGAGQAEGGQDSRGRPAASPPGVGRRLATSAPTVAALPAATAEVRLPRLTTVASSGWPAWISSRSRQTVAARPSRVSPTAPTPARPASDPAGSVGPRAHRHGRRPAQRYGSWSLIVQPPREPARSFSRSFHQAQSARRDATRWTGQPTWPAWMTLGATR
jgi:hypothetical protein